MQKLFVLKYKQKKLVFCSSFDKLHPNPKSIIVQHLLKNKRSPTLWRFVIYEQLNNLFSVKVFSYIHDNYHEYIDLNDDDIKELIYITIKRFH